MQTERLVQGLTIRDKGIQIALLYGFQRVFGQCRLYDGAKPNQKTKRGKCVSGMGHRATFIRLVDAIVPTTSGA